MLANIIVGIVGGVLGGFVLNLFGVDGVTGFNLWSLAVALAGAIVALWAWRMFHRQEPSDACLVGLTEAQTVKSTPVMRVLFMLQVETPRPDYYAVLGIGKFGFAWEPTPH